MRFNFPKVLGNPLSLLGSVIATVALGASAFALALDLFVDSRSPYQGILTFFVFPSFLFLGLFLVIVGAIRQKRRLRRTGGDPKRFPVIDLNVPQARRFWFVFGVASLAILLLSVLGAFRAYEFTDSVAFCGKLCHEVMEPEHTAYLNSPHARVKCVDCHVGPGAGWYVKSKLSGLYQVYAVLANVYPRPIPTPIEDLRPAQETCEECHWPEKFWGAQLSTRKRFGYDPLNEPREILMLVKTGGGSRTHGPSAGIHWHMNIRNRIEYVARDPKRMDIPWVKSTGPDGVSTVYATDKDPPAETELATLPVRRMDCMDCHNRPSHLYLSPEEGVDASLDEGRLDPAMPSIKEAAVSAFRGEFSSKAEAEEGIAGRLRSFYSSRYTAIPPAIEEKLPAAGAELFRIYGSNFFPHMRANWSVYPTQIGHRLFPGCFRCHDGRHKTADGKKTLTDDCSACHTFVARTKDGMAEVNSNSEFVHPFQVEAHFSKNRCWDCHTGGAAPYGTCAKCHEDAVGKPGSPMAFACSACHKPLKVKAEKEDCLPCHEVSGGLHEKRAHKDCTGSCHQPHGWKPAYPDSCTGECHEDLDVESHHKGEPCSPCHDFRGVKSTRGLPEARGATASASTGVPPPAAPPGETTPAQQAEPSGEKAPPEKG
jgi:hypothetical protein